MGAQSSWQMNYQRMRPLTEADLNEICIKQLWKKSQISRLSNGTRHASLFAPETSSPSEGSD